MSVCQYVCKLWFAHKCIMNVCMWACCGLFLFIYVFPCLYVFVCVLVAVCIVTCRADLFQCVLMYVCAMYSL